MLNELSKLPEPFLCCPFLRYGTNRPTNQQTNMTSGYVEDILRFYILNLRMTKQAVLKKWTFKDFSLD